MKYTPENSFEYTLSTGKVIDPNMGIIGLSADPNFDGMTYGCDGDLDRGKFEGQQYCQIPLTVEEQIEIAEYMSDLWRHKADTLRFSLVADDVMANMEDLHKEYKDICEAGFSGSLEDYREYRRSYGKEKR